ncbi:MAG: type II secretion system protein [Candidatus Colwellbacteria bacterium]|nr:type II secretion system protein [Candidatus Colwellbacteria bacterium]
MSISSSSALSSKRKRAFTLIELAIVIGVISVLSGVLFGYGKGIERRLDLLNMEARVINLILHAKSLAQSFEFTPQAGQIICGYGVHIDKDEQEIFIFQDTTDEEEDPDCALIGVGEYSSGDVRLEGERENISFINSILQIYDGTTAEDIVFFPPEPTTLINNRTGTTSASVIVHLTTDTTNQFEVVINHFGQVTTR